MYGLILCAGEGNRMQPLSGILPKPLLPIDNRPVIYHTLQSFLALSDIDRVGLVIQSKDKNIFQNFLTHYFSEKQLGQVDIFFQSELSGIMTAIRSAHLYKGHDILVCAGDTRFDSSHIAKFIESRADNTDIIIGIRRRSKEEILKRSMIMIDDNFKVQDSIEKPTEDQFDSFQSTWSGVPIWYFSAACWDIFPHSPPSNNGEFAVEGVIKVVITQKGTVKGVEISDTRDITTPKDILLENFDYINQLLT